MASAIKGYFFKGPSRIVCDWKISRNLKARIRESVGNIEKATRGFI